MLTGLLEEILMPGWSPERCTSPANYLPYSLTATLSLSAVQAALCWASLLSLSEIQNRKACGDFHDDTAEKR